MTRKNIILTALFAALAVVVVVVITRPPGKEEAEVVVQPTKQVETPLSDLTRKEGRWYQAGDTNPFTGLVVDSYASDVLKSRSAVSNGLLHGVSEGWHTNGQLQVSEHFQAGVSHGPRTKWYAKGAKLSEATIVEGKLTGPFRRWHENGVMAEQIEMVNGQPEGLSVSYYPSGFLKARVEIREGKALQQKLWKDGELKEESAGQK